MSLISVVSPATTAVSGTTVTEYGTIYATVTTSVVQTSASLQEAPPSTSAPAGSTTSSLSAFVSTSAGAKTRYSGIVSGGSLVGTATIMANSKSSSAVHGGGIAGIVVGVLGVVCLLALLGWFLLRRRRQLRSRPETHGTRAGNSAIFGRQEKDGIGLSELPGEGRQSELGGRPVHEMEVRISELESRLTELEAEASSLLPQAGTSTKPAVES